MARQTSREKYSPLARKYHERYVRFSEQLHNAWVFFQAQAEIIQLVEAQCKDEPYCSKIILQGVSPVNSEKRARIQIPAANLSGIIRRACNREIPELVLLNAVSLFEAFVSDIAKIAYLSDPERFLLRESPSNTDSYNNEKENMKLLRILVQSSSREEAIERHVEEKLRGIFYGNPVDIFKKNKLGFNIHQQITNDCASELELYSEIVARRNIIVHNLGIVDQKYFREATNSHFNPGDKITVDGAYLYQVLQTLNTLAKRYVIGVAYSTTGQGLPTVRMGETPDVNATKKAKTSKVT